MAHKMLAAINIGAWEQTNLVQWTFRESHHYLWHKQKKLVQVKWGNNEVLLNLSDLSNGKVLVGEREADPDKQQALLQKAWEYFINDSFWLIAPTKVFDKGVTRQVVMLENGRDALLVTYQSGGVTPGDSYLWILDENGLPESYQMWVSIIPIGGLKATWENWKQTFTGVMLPTLHQLPIGSIAMDNVKTGFKLTDLGINDDPFSTSLKK